MSTSMAKAIYKTIPIGHLLESSQVGASNHLKKIENVFKIIQKEFFSYKLLESRQNTSSRVLNNLTFSIYSCLKIFKVKH